MDAKDESFHRDALWRAHERSAAEVDSDAVRRSSAPWRVTIPKPALERLRRQLEARERELWMKIVDERNRVQDEAQSQQDSVGDLVDQAFVTTQVTMERDLIDRCMSQLDEIARTRDRIANGEFGVCVDCHEPIESGRLRANPVASRCTECQMVREKEAWINAR
jgi:RNA polymerase-binding protein DksA